MKGFIRQRGLLLGLRRGASVNVEDRTIGARDGLTGLRSVAG
jgi:hypothetical protein